MPRLRPSTRPHGHEAIEVVRGKVVQFRSTALPRAAEAAESTGEAVSKFALSSSRQVARALRKRQPSAATSVATLLPPLLRTGARFAARNPAVIAAAGLGLAALSFVAWRRQRAEMAAEAPDTADAADDQPPVREL
ncbi:MAG: hypothetical protein BGP16_02365 [Sphingobium sp. 66-54]|nr:MAG: hypothetical protein BGP16_02365 [Sphingobium sp. 66-54]